MVCARFGFVAKTWGFARSRCRVAARKSHFFWVSRFRLFFSPELSARSQRPCAVSLRICAEFVAWNFACATVVTMDFVAIRESRRKKGPDVLTDIEIAQAATPEKITVIAERAGVPEKYLEQ